MYHILFKTYYFNKNFFVDIENGIIEFLKLLLASSITFSYALYIACIFD